MLTLLTGKCGLRLLDEPSLVNQYELELITVRQLNPGLHCWEKGLPKRQIRATTSHAIGWCLPYVPWLIVGFNEFLQAIK